MPGMFLLYICDMAIHVEPNDSLLQDLKRRLKVHNERISHHQEQIRQIEAVIDFLETSSGSPTIQSSMNLHEPVEEYGIDRFKRKSFWRESIIKFLQKQDNAVQSSRIYKAFTQGYDIDDLNKRHIMSVLSSVLADLAESGDIVKVKYVGTKGFHYQFASL